MASGFSWGPLVTAKRAPVKLKAAGRTLWRSVSDSYELREDERQALEAACRTLDELRRLEEALADAPVVVKGSKGQTRTNPLFAEVRAHRLTLRQLLRSIGLVDEEGGGAGYTRSSAGSALARQRWGQSGAA